eukprot:SAG31_NODE_19493_length_600_cov_0.988024_2_plen_91_part_00
MISYSWKQQEAVIKIRKELGVRGYRVWIDIEQMRGSTVDAMAEAIDSASVMLYCISESYKSSQNCRCGGSPAGSQYRKLQFRSTHACAEL